jgi:SPP1 gp7 family putative phage head morphogenesis protein
MMSQLERNAWIEQAKKRILEDAKMTDSCVSELMDLYDEAANGIEKEIQALYAKYAKDNSLSDAEASKLLSGEQYSKWKKSIDKYVQDAKGNSKTLLELNTLAAKAQISRKEELLANIYQNMIHLSGETEKKVTDLLGDILKVSYYKSCHHIQCLAKVGFHVAKIDDKLLDEVLNYPWSEKTFSENLWGKTDKIAALARREITNGFISGSSVQQMTKAINDVMKKGRLAAERVVRTESRFFSNQGQIRAYKELGISEYTFLGAGCELCAPLNGQHFPIAEAEAMVNLPPIHPNCKCTTYAHFADDFFQGKGQPLEGNPKFEAWKKKYVDTASHAPIMELTDNEQLAVNKYVSSESYILNEKLRNATKLTSAEKDWVENLDKALSKLPEVSGTLYRSVSDFGIDSVETFLSSHIVGSMVNFPSYLSTSQEVYDEDFPVQYVISSRHGKDLQSVNHREKEVVFKRDSKFYVTKVEGHTIYLEEAE